MDLTQSNRVAYKPLFERYTVQQEPGYRREEDSTTTQ